MNWLPQEFYWLISCTAWSNRNEVADVRNAWGHNMAFRKEAFDICGLFRNEHGFHKGDFAEDNELSLRVRLSSGKRIVFNPRAQVWHKVHPYRLSWRWIVERSFFIGQSRRKLQQRYPQEQLPGSLLSTEYGLLGRILMGLLPRLLLGFLRHPIRAWRQLSLSVVSLAFVSLGYASGLFNRRAS
jgi:GT2 family glycosyltransferase